MTKIVGINLVEEKLRAYDKGYDTGKNEIKGRLIKAIEDINVELRYAQSMGHKQAEVAYQNCIDAINIQLYLCN